MVLEMVQNQPGIGAAQLAERLSLTDRAVRRYVAVLREAGVPVESTRGRYGGYRIGRGLRVPPLMFTPAEAMALVMAAVEGRGAADPSEPVGSALAKIIRVLPERVAGPVRAVRSVASPGRQAEGATPDPELTAALVEARESRHRVAVSYRTASGRALDLDLEPWAVVVRHGLWYLLCWSHTADARRVLRIDRVSDVRPLGEPFAPPGDLDPVRMLEEQLSQGWTHEIEVVIDAPMERVRHWIPRTVGRLEPMGHGRTRLLASTDELNWYAEMLAFVRAPFRVVRPAGLREELAALGERLARAGEEGPDP